MAHIVTIHLHNVAQGMEAEFANWFEGPHLDAVKRLDGFLGAERYEVTAEQVMADIAQPWRYLTVYEFACAQPGFSISGVGAVIDKARSAGLIDDAGQNERLLTYNMYSDWVFSPNHVAERPFSGISIILANFTPGQEAEYHHWYDNTHCPEVTRVPGKVAMKRGKLSQVQLEPKRFTYGGELVLCAQQTDNLGFTVRDFSARAGGRSPSGIAFEPRSKAGSFARTVHYFRKISGTDFWSDGIAYAGDLSVYPELSVKPLS